MCWLGACGQGWWDSVSGNPIRNRGRQDDIPKKRDRGIQKRRLEATSQGLAKSRSTVVSSFSTPCKFTISLPRLVSHARDVGFAEVSNHGSLPHSLHSKLPPASSLGAAWLRGLVFGCCGTESGTGRSWAGEVAESKGRGPRPGLLSPALAWAGLKDLQAVQGCCACPLIGDRDDEMFRGNSGAKCLS